MIFTFYSYKGGVGRSMAMASVAHLFARRGLRVLAIDFDLEAPGIERYFFDGERCRSVRAQPGLMDLIRAYRDALSSEAAFSAGEFQRWQSFRLTAINVAGSQGGSVDLMTAGRREPEAANRDYALAVRTFDWQDFFYRWKGDLFFDWLRRQLTNPDTGYDVVLVDSRTGVTEMGGVCAYQLADAAVLLCAPNYQNLDGTADVVRDFRSESVRALRRGKPLEILTLPARLEPAHPGRAGFLDLFKQQMGVEGLPAVLARAGLDYEKLALPYLPQFAVAEQLVGDTQQAKGGLVPVVEAFERLADALTLLAPPDTALGKLQGDALQRLTGGGSTPTPELVADTTKTSAGYDAFVDFCEADLPLAQEIAARLEKHGHRAFLDVQRPGSGADPSGATPEALAYSSALLVCLGRPTDNERRARTIAQARRLQTVKIIPVLLPSSDERALASFDLSVQQGVDLRNWNDADAHERLLGLVQSAARPQSRAAAAPVQHDPYPGARAFREDDAAYFFGRESDVETLLDALSSNDVVLLTGAARIGKTSLIQAGLLPRLRHLDPAGAPYFETIRCEDLTSGPSQAGHGGLGTPVLQLIDHVDSFERNGSDRARAERLEWLQRAIAGASDDNKLILIGRDAFGAEHDFDVLGLAQRPRVRHVVLQPLNRESLQRAIEEPARRAAHLLEPGLAERLIESAAASFGAIGQIQEALAAIWPERKRGWLTNKSLDAAGHLGGIVGRAHMTVLDALAPDRRAAARALFTRLVTPSTSYAIVPAPQPWSIVSTLPALGGVDALALRDELARGGVVDLFRAEAFEFGAGSSEVMVGLTRPNPLPYLELDGAKPDLRFLLWRDPTYGRAVRWRKEEDAVLQGAALAEAFGWLASHGEQLTAWEREFIQASETANENELERARRRAAAEQTERAERERERREEAEHRLKAARRTRVWLAGGLVFAVLLAVVALLARMDAQRSAAEALASEQVARAEALNARAEKQSTDIALASTEQARASLEEALVSANAARAAAEQALTTQSVQARQELEERLRELQGKIDTAQTNVTDLQKGCPVGRRLYLQIASEYDREAARALIPDLEKNEFIVPGIELTASYKGPNQVRYFRQDEVEAAREAAALLAKLGLPQIAAQYVSGSETSKTIRPCHYEAWFGPGAFRRAAAK